MESSCGTASSPAGEPNAGNEHLDSSETETEDELELIYWPFHSIGAPDDTLVPKDPICQSLSKLLSRVPQDDSEYSFGGAATMLPTLPGLYIKGVGDIALPLRRENAVAIENRGTKLRDKVWMCIADDLEMKNPEWDRGIKTLCQFSAERLGFNSVELVAVQTMVLLYAEGGQLEKQQVSNPTRRCVASLAIQLPSYFSGGEVVIHEEGTGNETCYALGKKKGIAAFAPHYLVHAAGSYRTVKKVESGYRLVMLYSLCMHFNSLYVERTRATSSFRNRLVKAVGELTSCRKRDAVNNSEETIVALMLSPSCTNSEIESAGSMAFTGEDRERFESLTAANAFLSYQYQLKLYVACLRYKLLGYGEEGQVQESISWYSISGGGMEDNGVLASQWTKRLSFLNPGNKTFGQLWRNSDAHGVCEHKRFAIIGRPVWADRKNPLAIVKGIPMFYDGDGDDQVSLANPQPLSTSSELQTSTRQADQGNKQQSTQVELCQNLAKSILGGADATLVQRFFQNNFARLKEKRELIPSIADMVKQIGWDIPSTFFTCAISAESFEERIGLALELADQLTDDPTAQAALTAFAVEKARMLFCTFPDKLAALAELQLLFKHALICANPDVLISVAALFNSFSGNQLGPIVDALSKCVDRSTTPSQRISIVPIFLRRRHWLLNKVEHIEKPFMWEVLDMQFPDAGAITSFLEGTNTRLLIRGFDSTSDAWDRVKVLRDKIRAPVEIAAYIDEQDVSVRIVKTGGAHRSERIDLPKYMAELERLDNLLVNESITVEIDNNNLSNDAAETSTNTTGKKRPRDEEPHVIEMDYTEVCM